MIGSICAVLTCIVDTSVGTKVDFGPIRCPTFVRGKERGADDTSVLCRIQASEMYACDWRALRRPTLGHSNARHFRVEEVRRRIRSIARILERLGNFFTSREPAPTAGSISSRRDEVVQVAHDLVYFSFVVRIHGHLYRRPSTKDSRIRLARGVVTVDGCPSQIRVIRSLDPGGLDAQAVAAVAQWQFAPGHLGDTPVDVLVTNHLDFRIW